MGSLWTRLGVAVAVAVSLAGVSVAKAAPEAVFVSKMYGYALTVPGAAGYWTSTYAILSWSAGSLEPGGPSFDTFIDSRVNRRYIIGARRLKAGETLAAWTTFFASPQGLDCRTTPSEPSTLSGLPARVFSYTCPDGIKGYAITTTHKSHGYFMVVSSFGSTSADRAAFEVARQGFHFQRD